MFQSLGPTTAMTQRALPPLNSVSRGARRGVAPLLKDSFRTVSVRAAESSEEAREGVATASVRKDAPTTPGASAASTPSPTSTSISTPTPLRLTLETREARQTLRFAEIWDGEAPAIVVTAVASSSAAAEFGVVAGSRLLSLPHPTRGAQGERWELRPGSAPISRVKDLIRVYRGVLIDMEFSREPISDEAIEAWVREQEERKKNRAREEGATASSSPPASSSTANPSTTLATASYDSDASYYPASAAAEREARALERRLRLRAERLAIDDARDDTEVIVVAAVAFLLPAAVILAVAYFSGYLDSMQANLS